MRSGSASRIWHKARLAGGFVSYLRDPVDPIRARIEIADRLASRDLRFLWIARDAIYSNPRSPHRALLRWAGWDYSRLARSVRENGLDATLLALRDDGVTSSLAEVKRGKPIRRDGLSISAGAARFDVAGRGAAISARTSGTTSGTGTEVLYDWSLFREEAAFECLLFDAHGVLAAPHALWLPTLPSISGVHNLLVHLRFRHVPERWFSHIPLALRHRPAWRYLKDVGGVFGLDLPAPEVASFEDAGVVARWLAAARDRAGTAVLKTFASSAVRVAAAALRLDLDLSRCLIFTGGEPLTSRRQEYIASTGARAFARYVATELGWIAGACPHGGADAMHVCTDRLAGTPALEGDEGGAIRPVLYTTVSRGTNMVFLNTDIGDAAVLGRRRCACPLGSAGLELELSHVAGHDKLSAEGMTMPLAVLRDELDELIAAAGGPPDSYQLQEEEDEHGLTRLVISISPDMEGVDERALREALIGRLPERGPGAELAARFWRDSGAIAIRREHPVPTPGMKISVRRTGAARFDPAEWAAVHGRGARDPVGLVFRRGVELARRACLEVASPGELWLDVGCGTGQLAAGLAGLGLRVVGIDSDPRMVRAATERFGGADSPRFRIASADRLPFEDGSLDGIVATSLAGLLDRVDLLLLEAERVLRSGGHAVVTFTNGDSLLHAAGARLARRPASPLHVRARSHSRRDVERLLAPTSLELTRLGYYNFFLERGDRLFPPYRAALALERLGGRAGALLGRNLIVVAAKAAPG